MKIVQDFSDLTCLERLRDDDVRAFDQLFDQFAPELCRFAHSHIKSRADAEDMVRDCFLKIWERRHEFDDGIVFKTCLYTTVYHAILKQLRWQCYWVFEDCGEETLIEEPGPGRAVEYQELEEFYQVALDQLPPRRREIFTLSRQQGLPNASIAKELNISVKCVENQMSHALKLLKLYFHAHGMSLALMCGIQLVRCHIVNNGLLSSSLFASLPSGPAALPMTGTATGRRTTAPLAWATSVPKSRSWASCCKWKSSAYAKIGTASKRLQALPKVNQLAEF